MIYVAICSTAWWASEADQSRYDYQYPSLGDWSTARAYSGLTLTEPETIEIQGDDWQANGYDISQVQILCTSSQTNYISIKTIGLSRHLGKWDESRYIIKSDIVGYQNIAVFSKYVEIDGLQILTVGKGNYTSTGIDQDITSANLQATNNIIKNVNLGSNLCYGIRNRGVNGVIVNNIIINFKGIGANQMAISDQYNNCLIYNNTIIDCTIGIGGGSRAINNLVFNCATPFITNIGFFNTNAFSSGTDPGTNGIDVSSYTKYDLFNDPDNEDYSLNVGAILVRQHGTNLTTDAIYPFTTDIAGQTRFPDPELWDIGAWHYSGSPVGDLVYIRLQNIIDGSRIAIEVDSDNSEVTTPFEISGVTQDVSFEYFEDTLILVKVRKSSISDVPRYKPYKANAMIGNKGVTIYVDQQLDEVLN